MHDLKELIRDEGNEIKIEMVSGILRFISIFNIVFFKIFSCIIIVLALLKIIELK